jgi:hypothetical protein
LDRHRHIRNADLSRDAAFFVQRLEASGRNRSRKLNLHCIEFPYGVTTKPTGLIRVLLENYFEHGLKR